MKQELQENRESQACPPRAVKARRLGFGSMGVLVFVAVAALMIPLWLGLGIYGAATDGQISLFFIKAKGLWLVPTGLGFGVFFTALLGVLAWPAAYLGVRLLGQWTPIRLVYFPANPKEAE